MAGKKPEPKKRGKKRHIWHSHFDAAMLLALAVLMLFYFVDYFSGAGIIMLASIAATVYILTHKYRHHLTKLGTATYAYFISGILAVALAYMMRIGGTPLLNQIVILVAVIGGILYWLNLVHPPAVFFSLAYLVFNHPVSIYFLILLSTIALFIAVRLAVYEIREQFDISHFFREFVKEEEEILLKEEKRIRNKLKKI